MEDVNSMKSLEITGSLISVHVENHESTKNLSAEIAKKVLSAHVPEWEIPLTVVLIHCRVCMNSFFETAIQEDGSRESFLIISYARTDHTFVSLNFLSQLHGSTARKPNIKCGLVFC